jgi:hypothetical protein
VGAFPAAEGCGKMHALLDLRGSIPAFIAVSDGKVHDVHLLDEIVAEPGAFYVMDGAYLDSNDCTPFTAAGRSFVTRTKTGVIAASRHSACSILNANSLLNQQVRIRVRRGPAVWCSTRLLARS